MTTLLCVVTFSVSPFLAETVHTEANKAKKQLMQDFMKDALNYKPNKNTIRGLLIHLCFYLCIPFSGS
jgi:hypothetical protein